MSKLKLMTIVGTRPEIIRLSEIIKKADVYFNHIFVHTGQNYDSHLNDIFYDDLNLRKPDYYLNVAGENVAHTIGNIISASYDLMVKEKPNALLILGDTNSALCSIAAKRLKIPIFHMEAGNRCFDENLPEETNRRIVDHIADVNIPYTEHARRYLFAEGIAKDRIFVLGSPMREVIKIHSEEIDKSKILEELKIKEKEYIILSAHREENINNEENFYELMNSINSIAERYEMPIIYSVHPRSEKFINERNFVFKNNVIKMRPFNFTDYSKLMKNAYCVISDSGTMPEEAAIEHFPGVCIRTSTERPEAIDRAAFVMAGLNCEDIINSIEIAVNLNITDEMFSEVEDYKDINVSANVIKLIQGYTPIVNEKVWGKKR